MGQGEIPPNKYHPAANSALRYLRRLDFNTLTRYLEAFSSCALADHNWLAEICAETLRRLLDKEPVSDRYLLGLAWEIRDMEEHKRDTGRTKGRARNRRDASNAAFQGSNVDDSKGGGKKSVGVDDASTETCGKQKACHTRK